MKMLQQQYLLSPPITTNQKSILSGLGDIFSSVFRSGRLGDYIKATIDKIKKNLAYSTEGHNLQERKFKMSLDSLIVLAVRWEIKENCYILYI